MATIAEHGFALGEKFIAARAKLDDLVEQNQKSQEELDAARSRFRELRERRVVPADRDVVGLLGTTAAPEAVEVGELPERIRSMERKASAYERAIEIQRGAVERERGAESCRAAEELRDAYAKAMQAIVDRARKLEQSFAEAFRIRDQVEREGLRLTGPLAVLPSHRGRPGTGSADPTEDGGWLAAFLTELRRAGLSGKE